MVESGVKPRNKAIYRMDSFPDQFFKAISEIIYSRLGYTVYGYIQ